ncbi:DNA/RNA polymerase [Parathielavia appendiculata]|uniref:DNA polymerase kappa n=1 Tax=Parathielavia appendiculata TaxID=2587402 RepID=A0AAN6Z473_9PEZI|nr:DNA/RNA polymerase [Parathielavia appendiculata]
MTSKTQTNPTEQPPPAQSDNRSGNAAHEHASLKYSLLGPSLTKAGQDSISEIIYNASKGSKFFNHEEARDKSLTAKIEALMAKKRRLETLDLSRELRAADNLLAQLELTRDLTQHIVHVDCDAFYAAVEQLDRPELKDLPFAVGGGVLTTCNYVARRFGCRSGMAAFVAKKLCPDLILLPLNFDKYNAKAAEVREVLADYDPRFESASIDEAYLNITEYCAEHDDMDPAEVVEQMRREIHEKTQITVSAGIAANARLAKICSNMNKPNGQFVLPRERTTIMAFMRDLPCRNVNGVGRVLERELAAVGVKTCGDIYPQRQYLEQLFGQKTHEFLLRCYLGLGRTDVQPAEEYERKSVGTESTFRDMDDPGQLREKLRRTAEELEADMRRAECKGRTLCLKVKLHTFEVLTRQVVPPRALYRADDLYNYSLPMLAKLEQEIPGMKLRLMGLRCTHLVSTKKPDARAFFGLRPRRSESVESAENSTGSRGIGVGGEGESEQQPRTNTGVEHNPRKADEDSGLVSSSRRHGKEIVSNPTREQPAAAEEELWDCPVCGLPQPADERLFNEHIDLCLSRRAIRDTVQQDAAAQQTQHVEKPTPDARKPKERERKRGRPPSAADPRQKKLCFG